MAWVRSGECVRCGECCMGDPFRGEMGPPVLPGACPFLRLEGAVHSCADRTEANAYYTNGCAHWPSIPEHVQAYPSCSYSFAWIDD